MSYHFYHQILLSIQPSLYRSCKIEDFLHEPLQQNKSVTEHDVTYESSPEVITTPKSASTLADLLNHDANQIQADDVSSNYQTRYILSYQIMIQDNEHFFNLFSSTFL